MNQAATDLARVNGISLVAHELNMSKTFNGAVFADGKIAVTMHDGTVLRFTPDTDEPQPLRLVKPYRARHKMGS